MKKLVPEIENMTLMSCSCFCLPTMADKEKDDANPNHVGRFVGEQEQELLIHGYCKSNASSSLPIDIINLIIKFYNFAMFWILQKDDYKNISVQDKDDDNPYASRLTVIKGPTFTTKDGFQFALILEVNAYVFCKVAIESLPDNVKATNTNIAMSIHEVNAHWRGNCTFSKFDDKYSWRGHTLKLKECLKWDQLTVSCHVDILSMTNDKGMKLLRPVTLNESNRFSRFEWNVGENDGISLEEFKNAANGKSFWPTDNFGVEGIFSLYCCPNGCMPSDKGNCVLFIQPMYDFSGKIGNHRLKYKMECHDEETGFHKFHEDGDVDLQISSHAFWPDGTVVTSDLVGLKSIRFVVAIELVPNEKGK